MDPITPSNAGCKYAFVVKRKQKDWRLALAFTAAEAVGAASLEKAPCGLLALCGGASVCPAQIPAQQQGRGLLRAEPLTLVLPGVRSLPPQAVDPDRWYLLQRRREGAEQGGG